MQANTLHPSLQFVFGLQYNKVTDIFIFIFSRSLFLAGRSAILFPGKLPLQSSVQKAYSTSLMPSYHLQEVLPTPKNRHLSVHEVSSKDRGKSSPGQVIGPMETNIQEQKLQIYFSCLSQTSLETNPVCCLCCSV